MTRARAAAESAPGDAAAGRLMPSSMADALGQVETPGLADRFIEAYHRQCYTWLGARLDLRPHASLSRRLRQSGFRLTPGLFKAELLITSLAAAIVAGALAIFVVALVSPTAQPLVIAPVVAFLVGVSTAAAYPFTLATRISNRKSQLERELPFSLSELAVLASIGLSPIELVRRMSQRKHDTAMTGEFRKVAYKADVQGKDLITALAETAKESPSDPVRQTLWDLANMMHQGGDLDVYLRNQSDEVLQMRRASQKDFIGRLQTYADMYVTTVLIGVMFLGVGAFLMDAFRSTAGGLNADALLLLLTYGIIPGIVVLLGVLLSAAHNQAGDNA